MAYMKEHPDIMVCATNYEIFGLINSIPKNIAINNMEQLRINLLFSGCDICHPSVMINHEMLVKNQIYYNEESKFAQDYEMWVNILQIGLITIIPDILLRKRCIESAASVKHRAEQIDTIKRIQKKQLQKLLGSVSDKEIDMHFAICHPYEYNNIRINDETKVWTEKLIKANNENRLYNRNMFSVHVYMNLLRVLFHSLRFEKSINRDVRLIIHYFPRNIYGIKALLSAIKKKYGEFRLYAKL